MTFFSFGRVVANIAHDNVSISDECVDDWSTNKIILTTNSNKNTFTSCVPFGYSPHLMQQQQKQLKNWVLFSLRMYDWKDWIHSSKSLNELIKRINEF